MLALIIAVAAPRSMSRAWNYLYQLRLPKLPAPESLPDAPLPNFRAAHPRLPAPTARDIEVMTRANPGFQRSHRERAKSGAGDLYSSILTARLEPGSQDLATLRDRVLAIKLDGRAADRTRMIALAYDWLHEQWPPEDRRRLLEKALEACRYEIAFIRDERLSPYNVILYNSPFQALVACAIATYRDDPAAGPVMNFTYDLWKNRVLPVWRQVMGRNGGWHEGGEYVGIGIGTAVYQVPAMWRHATGEDIFVSEPGLRGFLDFAIRRTRPDGTDIRLGDGGYFLQEIPDQVPLAIEYRHAAAYTLRKPGGAPHPSSWPWGPLSDSGLVDPGTVDELPLATLFDGIGLVIARSDWTPDATFVTFKAGDNYWSHSHLDQGGFTIYKGGELAIDSGANYGSAYGSDHHMNYSYQSIAHNTITVTDPDDTVPAPAKPEAKPRPIANDGGQRRIGSGWGVDSAPLDLAEWQAKREIYHTGRIVRYLDQDGIIVAVADITPAYTNSYSGKGTFSHRTRRVERLWRVFAYDRVEDVVLVYDEVIATEASFAKRWLLHTQNEPRINGRRFEISMPPGKGTGRAGGQLEGHVLLPRAALVNSIGGPGFEFFVAGRNYGGGVQRTDTERARPEPGRWRIELQPERDAAADQFLVVLLPSRGGVKPQHQVRPVETVGRAGCEVVGTKRTTRWWFEPGKQGVQIEIQTDASAKRIVVAPDA